MKVSPKVSPDYAIRAYDKCSRRGNYWCQSMCGDGEVGHAGYHPLIWLFVSGNRKRAQRRIFYDAASVHHCVSFTVTTSRCALKRYAKRTSWRL